MTEAKEAESIKTHDIAVSSYEQDASGRSEWKGS